MLPSFSGHGGDGGGVFWLGDQYGVDRAETINLLVSSAGFVVVWPCRTRRSSCIWLFGVCSVAQVALSQRHAGSGAPGQVVMLGSSEKRTWLLGLQDFLWVQNRFAEIAAVVPIVQAPSSARQARQPR